jgi:transcriptional regulator
LSTKAELQWRRAKIIEMKAIGLSQMDIARELQVSEASISSDVQYLRKQARESIKEYVTQHLPEQYQICLCALDTILKHSYKILQEAHDNREKVAALELFKDTHVLKLELLSNATTIDHALEYIRSKQHQQQHRRKNNEDSGDSPITATATGKQSVF